MMRRGVWIPVDDPGIEYLKVGMYEADGSKIGKGLLVPVPSDDQATRDLQEALRIVESSGWSHRHELVARLRAWAGIEGSET